MENSEAADFQFFGDWRDLRRAIERAAPDWGTASEETRKQLWDFAQALIDEHPVAKAQCRNCRKIIWARSAYRCADCKTHYCETCIRPHFGPNHRSHT